MSFCTRNYRSALFSSPSSRSYRRPLAVTTLKKHQKCLASGRANFNLLWAVPLHTAFLLSASKWSFRAQRVIDTTFYSDNHVHMCRDGAYDEHCVTSTDLEALTTWHGRKIYSRFRFQAAIDLLSPSRSPNARENRLGARFDSRSKNYSDAVLNCSSTSGYTYGVTTLWHRFSGAKITVCPNVGRRQH